MGDDDLLPENSLSLRADFIKKNPGIDWFYGKGDWINEKGEKIAVEFQSEYFDKFLYERMLIHNRVHGGTPTVKRGLYQKVRWPEWLKRSEDYFVWLELLRPENKFKVGFLGEVIYVYRWHQDMHTLDYLYNSEKLQKKKELNNQIKGLHPDNLLFFVNEIEKVEKEKNEIWRVFQESQELTLIKEREKENEIAGLKNELQRITTSRGWRFIEKMRKYYRLRKNPIILIKLIVKGIGRKIINPRLRRILNRLIYNYLTRKIYLKNEEWGHENPLISIVIPFYSGAETIGETINSVLGQTFQDFECLIVNASTQEKSVKKLNEIKHPKIQIIHQENQGVAVARNTGVAKARGKYVMCLDDDDIIDPTYIEKGLLALESDPNYGIFTVDMEVFGERSGIYQFPDFDPLLIRGVDNPIVTAAIFRKVAWERTGGYKQDIGYEDWEYWVSLVEKGFWPKHIPETIFRYRTANKSRFKKDSKKHYENIDNLKKLHPHFISEIKKIKRKRLFKKYLITQDSALVNVSRSKQYAPRSSKKGILIAIPWMTFGGAETLIYNYCGQIKEDFDISFVTGLESKHEWEYKFKEITSNIYHLANLFDDKSLYLEFFSNYIKTRDIDVLHIIHNNFVYEFLPELKKRFPKLKIIVTLFNDFAVHFNGALDCSKYIDVFTSDNNKVVKSLKEKIPNTKKRFYVFPNATDCYGVFNPQLFNREEQRKSLNVSGDDLAVFFIGRLSSEKKPDTFLDVAGNILKKEKNIKFFMIGDGPMKESLLKKISEINDPNLTYLGYQSQIPKYLSAADVFVLPSIVEGFPLSIVEAMSMRTVVIASDVGAISDVIESGKEGFVVTPASVEEITEKILLINKDKEIMGAISDRARAAVEEKYSTVILGNNYKRLYEEK
ncbi:MAG: Glycosyl transferase family 2 [candidate division CPR2 bacterium GW2011_GWC2_39_10]|uniref:Glycosyl transferase family 2 n=1 Tax=candidate division CPR2 bacterium GW2011_GWC2_39_10 TaxID=1618345 RepID=A0A0G0M2B2_UNCC2|nr:MAG: Glycosyl transferase family 2 [candidate division CPR2 bacterium GW2011_GWC2_39_10]